LYLYYSISGVVCQALFSIFYKLFLLSS
jgi:hypothetical protein